MNAMGTGRVRKDKSQSPNEDENYESSAKRASSQRYHGCLCISSIEMRPEAACLLHFDELMSNYHVGGTQIVTHHFAVPDEVFNLNKDRVASEREEMILRCTFRE